MQSVLSVSPNNPLSPLGVHNDLRVFAAHGVYGYPVVTSLPVLLPDGSIYNQPIDRIMVRNQIECAFVDSSVTGINIGELSQVSLVSELAGAIRDCKPSNVVCNPNIPSFIGKAERNQLLDTFVLELLPLCNLLVLDLSTAKLILDEDQQNLALYDICTKLVEIGANAVLLVGVKPNADANQSICIFQSGAHGQDYAYLSKPSKPTESNRGDYLSLLAAAVCSNLVLGKTMSESINLGINYARQVIATSSNAQLFENKFMVPNNHFLDVVVTDLLENDTLDLEDRPEKIENLTRYVNVGKVNDTE